ncbi:MAG: YihY/virulence factor BrkB family protein [Geminicoccaceae bacterium]
MARAIDQARWLIRRVKAAINHFNEDAAAIVAGHIAFAAMLAFFPFLIFVVTIAGEIGRSDAALELVDGLLRALPPEVSSALAPTLDDVLREPPKGLWVLSLATSLWAASSGIESLRYALNLAYGIGQTKAIWRARIESALIVIALALVGLFSSLVLFLGPLAWQILTSIGGLSQELAPLYRLARLAFALAVIALVTSTLYRALSHTRLSRREVFPGACFVAVGWTLLVEAFSTYASEIADVSVTYGSLGGVVLTLLFFYLVACLFLFGAELNATTRRITAPG